MDRQEFRHRIIAKYLKVDIKELKYLGSGNFADAFLYKDKVYKLTDDTDDYVMANKLVKEGHKFPHFVKVYKTKLFHVEQKRYYSDERYTTDLYLIVSEKVTPMSQLNNEVNQIWSFLRDYNSSENILRGCPVNIDPQMPNKDRVDRYEIHFLSNPLTQKLYKEMETIFKWYSSRGLQYWDNHERNLSYQNGKIKIFDFGYSILKDDYKYSKRKRVVLKYEEVISTQPKEERTKVSSKLVIWDMKSEKVNFSF